MVEVLRNGRVLSASERYRTLLAVTEAIVSQREVQALFHDLANQLRQVVRFDYLVCHLHDAASNTIRLHVLEAAEPVSVKGRTVFSVEEHPGGMVLQTQHPAVVSNLAGVSRWPRFLERWKQFGVNSGCFLPLTTARRRLGALTFGCKEAGAYDAADVDFLQQVANQVALAVENALAFEEIQGLKDQLLKEKVYLEEE